MNYDQLFTLINILVAPFWFLMIVVPRWSWSQRIIASPLIALPPALIYLALVVPQIVPILASLSNPSVASVMELLGTPAGITIAWAHFLAFDLLVGRWAYLDSQARNIHSLWMVVPLFCIFMLGPVGFCLYLALRTVYALRGNNSPQKHSLLT